MTISSRTPEGQPTQCPLCAAVVVVEPSVLFGDATCPNCGQLLWFVSAGDSARIFDATQPSPVKDRLLEIIACRLGISRDKIIGNGHLMDHPRSDSIETVELVMALEEELNR